MTNHSAHLPPYPIHRKVSFTLEICLQRKEPQKGKDHVR